MTLPPPLFMKTLENITESLENNIFFASDITSVTAKNLYLSMLDNLPPPKVETKFPDYDWALIWRRLCSGVLSPVAKSLLYLIVHDRVSTRDRGFRLMPRKFCSPMCVKCEHQERETCSHRYLHCVRVSESWEWLRTIIVVLDPCTGLMDDESILRLNFSRSLRDNAVIWLIGVYVEIVDNEIINKDNNIDHRSLVGFFRQRQQQSNLQAIPYLGPIPGIDWEPQGIG